MQRRGGAGHFGSSTRVAISAGSEGAASSESDGAQVTVVPGRLDTGQGPPKVMSRGRGGAEESIDSRPETDLGTSGDAASRFEPRDVPPFLPFWLGVLIAAFVVGVLVWVTIGFPLADHQQYRGPLKTLAPAPRLETAPVAERERYDAAKRQELKSIEAAMRATAEQGWGPPK